MKYHDSITEAEQVMALAVEQLSQWQLPVNPINYAVSYEYHSTANNSLNETINQQLKTVKQLDNFFMEQLYKDYVLEQSQFRHEIIADLSQLLNITHKKSQQSSQSASVLISELDNRIPQLSSDNEATVHTAIAALIRATEQFKAQQAVIDQELQSAKEANQLLSRELAQVRAKMNTDPVTGLFNQESISSHLTSLRKTHSHEAIFAIVVRVNNFNEFSQQYSIVLADVILAKVANKVASYVNDSGLSSRTGYDEFLLLLPGIDINTANEIGEKISQGVSKLRFVSVKSSVKLPPMTIAFASSEMKAEEDIAALTQRIRKHLP